MMNKTSFGLVVCFLVFTSLLLCDAAESDSKISESTSGPFSASSPSSFYASLSSSGDDGFTITDLPDICPFSGLPWVGESPLSCPFFFQYWFYAYPDAYYHPCRTIFYPFRS